MRHSFWRYCKVVAIVHVAIVLLFTGFGWIRSLFRKKPELILPIEFVVDVTPQAEAVTLQAPPEPPRPPDPPPPDEVIIPEKIVKPPREKKKIEIGKRVNRPAEKPRPDKPRLTPQEIARLLAMGAKPSDHTVVPDEDQRCMARIRDTLHAAWLEPSAEAAIGRESLLTIRLGRDGRITGGELERSSGSRELDTSVLQVLQTVRTISGLTPGFVARYPAVTIAFTVEP